MVVESPGDVTLDAIRARIADAEARSREPVAA